MRYLKPGPCPGKNKTWLHHEVKYRTDFCVLYRILCEGVKTSVECRWTFLVICSVPNLGYSPDSSLKLKYIVKKCGDISSYHWLYFWNALNPFSLQTLFFFQVAKCFFPMYPFHCFCSYGSDFSLKNMYNFSHRTCSCTHSLCHRFLFDFVHVCWGPRARPVCRCQYSAVFVLLFAASDADSSSAVAFCLSWNSFVDSTGFFLNLCLYSA